MEHENANLNSVRPSFLASHAAFATEEKVNNGILMGGFLPGPAGAGPDPAAVLPGQGLFGKNHRLEQKLESVRGVRAMNGRGFRLHPFFHFFVAACRVVVAAVGGI